MPSSPLALLQVNKVQQNLFDQWNSTTRNGALVFILYFVNEKSLAIFQILGPGLMWKMNLDSRSSSKPVFKKGLRTTSEQWKVLPCFYFYFKSKFNI